MRIRKFFLGFGELKSNFLLLSFLVTDLANVALGSEFLNNHSIFSSLKTVKNSFVLTVIRFFSGEPRH